MRSTSDTRLEWVDAGKGISILLVVLYHSTEWLAAARIDLAGLTVMNAILADLRMPVFFFLAGLFARSWIGRSWSDLLRFKLAALAWVYLLWSVIELPTKWLAAAAFTTKVEEEFIIRQVAVIALIPFRTSGSIWFIWALVVFFVLAKLTATWPLWLQLAAASAAALATRALPEEINEQLVALTGLGYRGALLYYLFFLLGAYFRDPAQQWAARTGPAAAVGIVAAWIALRVGAEAAGIAEQAVASFLLAAGGMVAGVALAVSLQHVHLLRYLGTRTLPIYLAHSPVIIVLAAVLSLGPALPTSAASTLAAAVAAVAVVLPLLLHARSHGVLRYLYAAPPAWKRRTAHIL